MIKESKELYEEAKLEVIRFAAQDIIATSGENHENESEEEKVLPGFDV